MCLNYYSKVFPPSFRELPPPPLELFDLDEEFASSKIRLAQVTNKCSDEDLGFYIQSLGTILNMHLKEEQKNEPKLILHLMLSERSEFKQSVKFMHNELMLRSKRGNFEIDLCGLPFQEHNNEDFDNIEVSPFATETPGSALQQSSAGSLRF